MLENKMLLVFRFLRFGNELNAIFGSGHFLQLFATLIGICTTSYNISQVSKYLEDFKSHNGFALSHRKQVIW